MAEKWLNRFDRAEFKSNQGANASFRGIPFLIEGSSTTFGRRILTHEFPLQDVPFTEDLGRKAIVYNVSGAILGGDYLTVRDNLAWACEKKDAGDLIHPYFGNKKVLCQKIEFSDSKNETRIVRFTAVFVEAGKKDFLESLIDTVRAVQSQTLSTIASFRNGFLALYDVASLPLIFTSGAQQALETAWGAIESIKELDEIGSEFFRDLKEARNDVESIVISGESTFDSLAKFVTYGLFPNEDEQDSIDSKSSYRNLNNLLTFQFSAEDQESSKTIAIVQLVRDVTAVSMAQNTSNISFDSATEAREFRNNLLAYFDEMLIRGLTQEATQEINTLRTLVVQDIDVRAISLPDLKIIKPRITQPTLVLSQLLYGTSENSGDINSRNNIEHPGFVSGGVNLEVLLND